MGFAEAVRSGLRNYVTFSGRARRSEYWWFALFVFLGVLVFSLLDAMIFGVDPVTDEAPVILSALFQLATLLPFLAVGWRRMHDAGYPGWYLLLPMALSLLSVFLILTGVFTVAMFEGTVEDPGALTGPAASLGQVWMLVISVLQIVLFFLIIWWLTRPSEPGPNAYGPPVQ
ncbi:MAG TPA: DUF805 domain-containing protein [Rhodobacteraceae bacterium]|jgi:uncharacterized membrane protein YhaH (DUF805 family)|nr:DUF805 domain-containing protein [Paracoccaceae bacterium]